ncbi:OLC1v1004475C1 [Oldenlandia corymbosa var. corymbosa]|uniref:OLC1v1004475C1 n=1 Tax=Oldenlandia corymbosa var. corymbosa TaxID=529605 RepID=A0AAV1DCF7_OLDCO|nr:OLC1v1004475C1 [Oldenlandia corymbosa var. corymbosa]
MSSLKEEEESATPSRRKVSCTVYFDALWFCYSPVHQMQNYYRLGYLDNCSKKWTALFDCLNLKTKRTSEAEEEQKHYGFIVAPLVVFTVWKPLEISIHVS